MIKQTENLSPSLTNFFSPRYWPIWLGLGITRIVVSLPHELRLALGKKLGKFSSWFVAQRRHIVEANLRLCFPHLSESELQTLIQNHWQALGMGMIEIAMSWWLDDAQLYPLAEIEGKDNLRIALAQGRGVILFTGHFTTLELGAHLLSIHLPTYPIHAMYRPLRNPLADAIVLRARSRRSPRIFMRTDIRTMIRSLKDGAIVWYATDQDQGGADTLFAPFFGIPAATLTTTSRLAQITDAAVVPYLPMRLANGHYCLRIFPALENFPNTPLQDATRLNELLAQWIRAIPEQYLWVHRRFKTRPPGIPNPYQK